MNGLSEDALDRLTTAPPQTQIAILVRMTAALHDLAVSTAQAYVAVAGRDVVPTSEKVA